MADLGYTEKNVRMNDYVGIGRYADVTWASSCPKMENGRHVLGLLGPDCVCCHAVPEVAWLPPLTQGYAVIDP